MQWIANDTEKDWFQLYYKHSNDDRLLRVTGEPVQFIVKVIKPLWLFGDIDELYWLCWYIS